jgi:hypothetical protein
MKPPFWEVTISRQLAANDTPIIESVNCFTDKHQAEEYGNQARHGNPLACVTVVHVDAVPAGGILVKAELWIGSAATQNKTRRRSVPA